MRILAALLVAPLLLAGCMQGPRPETEADGSSGVGAGPGAGDSGMDTPMAAPAAERANAGALLPVALRWARAWEDDAELVAFTSTLGKDGAPELGPVAQPLDGEDALWAFRFTSPSTRGVLVVQLRADGEKHDVFATGGAEPREPLDELGIGTRESRWLAVARTQKVVDALAEKPETEAWAGADVDAVSYEMVLREGETPRLTVTAWRGERYFVALVDADAWKLIVGGEVPPPMPAPTGLLMPAQ